MWKDYDGAGIKYCNYLAEGHTQPEMARILQVALSTVNRDYNLPEEIGSSQHFQIYQ